MRRGAAFLLALSLICATSSAVRAVEPDEMLPDPALEQRARDIGQRLRCLVCQNQSIDDSQADLAHDLRVLVRDRIKAGDTDQQVIDFVVSRYGNFVLLKPPVNRDTVGLWFGPLALAVLGLAGIAIYFARRPRSAPPPLTEDERKRLNDLLGPDTP